MRNAAKAEKAGETARAIVLYDMVLRKDPDNKQVLMKRVKLHLANKDFGRAQVHYIMKNWQLALDDLDRFLALRPGHAAAMKMRSKVQKLVKGSPRRRGAK